MTMRATSRKPLSAITALAVGLLLYGPTISASTDELVEARRLMKQGQAAAALQYIDAYLASKPKDPQGPFLKGLILLEMGNRNEALVVFTKLNEDYPELPEPYNNLAVLYAQQKQYEKARVTLEMAIRADPSYALARENLGDVYSRLASQAYDQALQLDPASKASKTKLTKLGELGLASTSSGGMQAAAPRPDAEAAKPTSSEPAKPAPAVPAVATATNPTARPASKPVATAVPTPPESKPGADASTTIVAAAPMAPPSSGDAPPIAPLSSGDAVPIAGEDARGLAGKGWDLIFSPYTYHYSYSQDHKPVVLLGLLKGLQGNWLVGGSAFSNSFGQPSVYLFGGQRYVSPFGFENWYLQWTAGLLYGYVGEYQDKVPLNYKGFSPGFVPGIGYQFSKRAYAELDLLGGAGLMFSVVFPLPKDWP